MSKTDIDYANTIIYKITCKDTTIKDVYVGHTTNFVQRKRAHKQSCINPKSTNHTCKLYTIIREHGGWTNWIMEIIHFFTCNDQCEARIKEQEYFILLNATLNSVEPMPTPKSPVKIVTKLKPVIKTVPIVIKIPKTYNCEICNYHTYNSTDYSRHIATRKHSKLVLSSNINYLTHKNAHTFLCNNCNKGYKERSGLWRHNKMHHPDVINTTEQSKDFVVDKEFVMRLIKENIELKNMMLDTQNKIIRHISGKKE
jgi:hypothetical protein